MKKLLLILLPVLAFGASENMRVDPDSHKVKKPSPSLTAPFDLDFSDVTTNLSGGTGGGTPGGANQQLQFNSAFTFGGIPYATFDGTAVTFRSGARFFLADPTDATKKVQFALANLSGTTKTVTILENSSTVIPAFAPANQFATAIGVGGTITFAQPLFSNLGGTLALSQTSMTSGKLLGRYTAGTGAIQEITVGANLTLSGAGVLDASGGGGGSPGGSDTTLQYNNAGSLGGITTATYVSSELLLGAGATVFTDNADPTKRMKFALANVPTATTRSVIVPAGANPVIVASDAGASNNFLTGITSLGVITKAQPAFTNISGTTTFAQQNIPIGKERFVDPVNGVDVSGAENLARPYLTVAAACAAASSGDVIYLYPNTSGYDQSTTPLVIPAGVTIVGAGPDTTLIKGSVTGVTRAVVEPSTASAIYNVSIQNTSSTGIPFGVGSSSTAFTSAFIGGAKVVGNAQGIYINKAGTTGLVVSDVTVTTQGDCLFQGTSTATTEVRNGDFNSDATAGATASRGLYVTNGTVLFDYGNITVGHSTGTNYGALGDGAGAVIELRGVRILNSGGGTNADVAQANSATVGVGGVFRSDAAAVTTSGTVTDLSRYAIRDNNLTDFPNIGSGTRGDIIIRNATGWNKLAAGLDGNVLTTHGTTADPTWDTAGGGGAVSDTAFSSAWNAATTTAASQNALYDYLHLFDTDDDGKVNVLDQVAGIVNTNGSGVIQTPLAIPAAALVGTTETQTLSNKRISKRRLNTSAPGATPTFNTDDYDVLHFTGLNAAITSMTTNGTGTPLPGDVLRVDFTDDGTARAIAWGGNFEASPGQALPTTTTASTRLDVGFFWNTATSKWRCMASSDAAAAGAGTVTSVGLTGANGITVTGATPITSSGAWALSLPITIAGTTGKTLTVSNSMTLAGTDGSTLNIGAGGTLGTNAFTSTAFLTASNISDSVFASGWNSDTTTAPSRNAIYDWGHTFDTDNDGRVDVLDLSTAELVKTDVTGAVNSAVGGTDYANLAFKTVSVSGQSDVVADTAGDTLTLAAGTNVTITTTPGTDTVTIAASGGGGSVDDTAFASSWNAVTTTAPSKNAVYDELHKIDSADDGTIVNAGTGFRIAGAATNGTILRSDGTNYVASAFTMPSVASTSGRILQSDGTNFGVSTPTWPTAASTTGKVVKSNGTNLVMSTETYAAPGTSGNVLTSDGTNWTSAAPAIDDTAYDATTWNGDTTHAPSKNAVRDKIETMSGGTPGGSNTQVQFNNSGAFGGDAGFTYATATTDGAKIFLQGTGGNAWYQIAAGSVGSSGYYAANGLAYYNATSDTTPLAITSTSVLLPNVSILGWQPGGRGSLADTALYRNAAGVIEINNGTPSSYRDLICRNITISGGNFSGRINPRATGSCEETSSATSTPLSDSCDQWDVTALAVADAFVAPSGTPVNGQRLTIRIKDAGAAKALSFATGSSGQYRFSSDLVAPTTTVLSKTLYMLFIYNAADSRWDNVAQINNL